MQTVHPTNRGQVLIIFVFAILGLLGITGLAIDGGNIYQDRRHAQNAADAAAMAAGLKQVAARKGGSSLQTCVDFTGPNACDAGVAITGLDVAQTNGYDNTIPGTVDIHTPPLDGYYATCSAGDCNPHDYVQVIIHSTVPTFFARVLGIGELHNRVEAVALARYRAAGPLFGGDALVILAPHAVNGTSGEFGTKGTAGVYVHGGDIFVNSDGSNAFVEASCLDFQMDANKSVNVVGGSDLPTCPTKPTVHKAISVQFPPDVEPILYEPAECSPTFPKKPSGLDGDGYTHLYPGYYDTSGSNKFPPATNTRLDPGVYCIGSLLKTTNPNTHLVGDGVLIYIKKGGAFNFGGGTVNLTAPGSGQPYAGYLLYATPDYRLSPGNVPECTINAGSGDTFTGVIYAPYCNVKVTGGSSSTGIKAKMIAYTLILNGSNVLTFNYDDSTNPGTPEVYTTGLFH